MAPTTINAGSPAKSDTGDSDVGGARLDALSLSGTPVGAKNGNSTHIVHSTDTGGSASTDRLTNGSSVTTDHLTNGGSVTTDHLTNGDSVTAVHSNGSAVFPVPTNPEDDVFSNSAGNQAAQTAMSVQTNGNAGDHVNRVNPINANHNNHIHHIGRVPSNLRRRAEQKGLIIEERDPQTIWPPEYCTFVANLPEPMTDTALTAAVTRAFSRFGTVHVKIRRDRHHMPFAFCTFTKKEHAQAAIEHGRGITIGGRPCRTEQVKANRAFAVYKRNGDDITEAEALALMSPLGEISNVKAIDADTLRILSLPSQAMMAEYAKFDAHRDVNSAFRHHPVYKVVPYDVKKTLNAKRGETDEAYLARYDVERRSIYVGNLLTGVTEAELTTVFSQVGNVIRVNICDNPTPNNAGVQLAYAFVTFEHSTTPDAAIEAFHRHVFNGKPLRVERKVSKERTPPRARPASPTGPVSAPAVAPVVAPPGAPPPATPGHALMVMPQEASSNGYPQFYMPQSVGAAPYGWVPGNGDGMQLPPMPSPVPTMSYYPGYWPPMSMGYYPQEPVYYYSPLQVPNGQIEYGTPGDATQDGAERAQENRN